MALITPYLVLDEGEDWLDQFNGFDSQPTQYPMAFFTRVTPYTPPLLKGSTLPGYILFYYVFAWPKD